MARLFKPFAVVVICTALKDEHGGAANSAELKRLICSSQEYDANTGSGREEGISVS